MKKCIITLIIVLILFIGVLSINKYLYEKNNYYFTIYKIDKTKTITVEDMDKQDKYIKAINKIDSLSCDYDYYIDKKISGKIYISSDKFLYISNDEIKQDHVISDIKFKSIYPSSYIYQKSIRFYAISEENSLYLISLSDNDINSIKLEKLSGYYTNFVDVETKQDKYKSDDLIFALGKGKYIYNVTNGMLYLPTTISLYNKIYVYEDNTMTNREGKLIADGNGNPYKIKYIFNVVVEDIFIENTSYIVVTEDNKFLYFNEDMTEVYESNRKIDNIEFTKYDPYISGLLTLTLDMNSKNYFGVQCNEYYCVNDISK